MNLLVCRSPRLIASANGVHPCTFLDLTGALWASNKCTHSTKIKIIHCYMLWKMLELMNRIPKPLYDTHEIMTDIKATNTIRI